MLRTGSYLMVSDNTGVKKVKILSVKKKKNLIKEYATVSDIVNGVVNEIDISKKNIIFKNKERVKLIVIAVTYKQCNKNGIFTRASENRGMPVKITRFITPVASLDTSPFFYGSLKSKKYKAIVSAAKHIF